MSTSYRSRGGYGRRSYPVKAGPVAKVNQRAGECRACGEDVPAGAGQLYREGSGAWSVQHRPMSGPPTGPWDRAPRSGGCPEATDAENARLHAAGFIGQPGVAPASERDRIAAAAARFTPAERPAGRRDYAYTGSGARMSNRYSRCEDAPCCGCCD